MGWIVTDRARGRWTRLAVLWGVVFPAGGVPATAGEVMDRIAADKVLRIGARTDAPPFAFEQDGRLGGFSVELCVAVGQALSMQPGLAGLEGRLVRGNAENRVDMLATGEIDILCGATTATLARREAVSFSIATFLTGVGSAVRADAPPLLREVLVETSPASASDVVVREALHGRRLGVR